MARPSMEYTRYLESLTWEWQPLADVEAEAGKLIQPGKALRRHGQQVATSHREVAVANPRQRTEAERIAFGRRGIIGDIRMKLKSKGLIEVQEIDGVRMVRLKDRRRPLDQFSANMYRHLVCTRCGTFVQVPDMKLSTLVRVAGEHVCPRRGNCEQH